MAFSFSLGSGNSQASCISRNASKATTYGSNRGDSRPGMYIFSTKHWNLHLKYPVGTLATRPYSLSAEATLRGMTRPTFHLPRCEQTSTTHCQSSATATLYVQRVANGLLNFRAKSLKNIMASQKTDAFVLGVGLTQFIKPRRTRDYAELGYEAGVKAMLDAQINFDEVEQGVACYCYGDTTSGQRIFYQFGMTTIPIYNTNNACATGSTGLHMARTLVRSGAADCVLVIGFEQMSPGSIKSSWSDRPSPMGLSTALMEETRGKHDSPRYGGLGS